MNTDKATSRPWGFGRSSRQIYSKVSGKEVATTSLRSLPLLEEEQECKANAYLIVRCVNSHDQLIEALEAAKIFTHGHACEFGVALDREGCECCYHLAARMIEAAAIAAAKEPQ